MVEISFAELEDFSTDLRRRAVIEGPTADLGVLVRQRLSLWSRRPFLPGTTNSHSSPDAQDPC
jgi:hypothetical protein